MAPSSQDTTDVELDSLITGTLTPRAATSRASSGHSPRGSIESQPQDPRTRSSTHSAVPFVSSASQPQNDGKKRFRLLVPLKKLGAWFLDLVDDRPYKVRETWENTIFHLVKRLVAVDVLALYIGTPLSQSVLVTAAKGSWYQHSWDVPNSMVPRAERFE